jgi:hypothetical protein
VTARWIKGDADDVIVVDDTYFPVLITTWFGAPSEGAVRDYFGWLHAMLGRALRDDSPLVNVTDSTAAGVPDATVRRVIAELTKKWESAGAGPPRVSSCVVVDSAVIRGVLQVLAWLHGDLQTSQVSTCEKALDEALDILRRAGRKPPLGLVPKAWRRPPKSAPAG